jgi:hypothetical protein
MKPPEAVVRRVYTPEFEFRMGVGETARREMEKDGRIPEGRVDPGSQRKYWLSDEVDLIVRGEWKPSDQEAA